MKNDSLYKLTIGAIASILATFLMDYLSGRFESKSISIIIMLAIVSIIIVSINYLAENIMEKSPLVRKLVLGSDYIEGYWYDITYDSNNILPSHGVIMLISYKDGTYVVNGTSYNGDGKRIATFRSDNSIYKDKTLYIKYESFTDYNPNIVELGIMQFQFENPPNSYSGFYIDYSKTIRQAITGSRVEKSELQNNNNFRTSNDKLAFIHNKLKELRKNGG
jgi:hypothetical protein